MKTIQITLIVFLLGVLAACNNSENKVNEYNSREPKTATDSLLKDVDDDHITGMSKMGRLTKAEQTTRRLLDSIENLPSKAKQVAMPLKVKLDSLQKELSYAEMAMNKWMQEFNMDSAINNKEERIRYLESEKMKVAKVKDAILNGLEKADSLLKDKF